MSNVEEREWVASSGPPMDIKWVKTPINLPGVAEGTQLNVLDTFKSDGSCPFGPGRTCLRLEQGYTMIFTETDKGIAWFREFQTDPE